MNTPPQQAPPPAPVPVSPSPLRFVGLHTTEIILVVLTNVGLVTAAAVEVLPPRWAGLSSAISVGCYAISRGLAKVGSAGAR